MFLQIVITKVGDDTYKVTFHDEKEVVFVERMTAKEVTETIFTSLQNLRVPDAQP